MTPPTLPTPPSDTSFPTAKMTLREQMWHEIASKVQDYMQTHPKRTATDAISYVITCYSASRYFIGYDHAKFLINTYQRQVRQQRRHRLLRFCKAF